MRHAIHKNIKSLTNRDSIHNERSGLGGHRYLRNALLGDIDKRIRAFRFYRVAMRNPQNYSYR